MPYPKWDREYAYYREASHERLPALTRPAAEGAVVEEEYEGSASDSTEDVWMVLGRVVEDERLKALPGAPRSVRVLDYAATLVARRAPDGSGAEVIIVTRDETTKGFPLWVVRYNLEAFNQSLRSACLAFQGKKGE